MRTQHPETAVAALSPQILRIPAHPSGTLMSLFTERHPHVAAFQGHLERST
jgi:hypothetical protein